MICNNSENMELIKLIHIQILTHLYFENLKYVLTTLFLRYIGDPIPYYFKKLFRVTLDIPTCGIKKKFTISPTTGNTANCVMLGFCGVRGFHDLKQRKYWHRTTLGFNFSTSQSSSLKMSYLGIYWNLFLRGNRSFARILLSCISSYNWIYK